MLTLWSIQSFNYSDLPSVGSFATLAFVQFLEPNKLVLPPSVCIYNFTAEKTPVTLPKVSISLLHVCSSERITLLSPFKAASPIISCRSVFCSFMTITIVSNMYCVLPTCQTMFQVFCRYQFFLILIMNMHTFIMLK